MRSLALALLAGLALGASAPPSEAWMPALAYAAALMIACEPSVRDASLPRAFGIGMAGGVGFGVIALTWVSPAVDRFARQTPALGWVATVATIAAEALAPALGCALYVAVAGRKTSALRAAACMAVAFDVVPMVFPWRPIAMALPSREVAQWLALGGGSLADFALAIPGCFLASGALRRRATDVVAGVGSLAVVFTVGAVRLHTMGPPHDTLRIGVIQPNVSLTEGRDRTQRSARLARIRSMTSDVSLRGVEVILWPESAHPYVFPRERRTDLPRPHDVGARGGAVVIAGIATEALDCRRWNGVTAITHGAVVGRVDKQRSMPFGDYVPLRWPWGRPKASCRDLASAVELAPIAAAHGLGALICYDEVEAWPARERVLLGARYLAGFTNDAWYDGTRQPHLHERMAAMRAVETERDLVRAVNTGLSSHIGADGRVLRRLSLATQSDLVVRVALRDDLTPYAVMGDAFGWTLVASVLWILRSVGQRHRDA